MSGVNLLKMCIFGMFFSSLGTLGIAVYLLLRCV